MSMSRSLSYFSVCLLMSLLLFGCAEMQMQETAPSSGGISTSSASSQVAATVDAASGTQGDTLAACMGRIPGNATAGQRHLAEMSCQRDERARQPILAVPGK